MKQRDVFTFVDDNYHKVIPRHNMIVSPVFFQGGSNALLYFPDKCAIDLIYGPVAKGGVHCPSVVC